LNGRSAILFIAHGRPGFTRQSLAALVESLTERIDLYLVDNASDGTEIHDLFLETATKLRCRTIVVRNDHNDTLSEVTNTFWQWAIAENYQFVGKVDNDTIIPHGFWWHARRIHESFPLQLGAVSALHFSPKTIDRMPIGEYRHNIHNGWPYGVLIQTHVGGCCYLLPLGLVRKHGFLQVSGKMRSGWTDYQLLLGSKGFPSCYVYPFHFCRHLDDAYYWMTHELCGETCTERVQAIGPEKQWDQEVGIVRKLFTQTRFRATKRSS